MNCLKYRYSYALSIILFAYVFLCFNFIVFNVGQHIDSGWIYYIAEKLLHGETIYSSGRRVFHAPFIFQLHAFWFWLTGLGFESSLILIPVFQAINSALFFLILKKLTKDFLSASCGSVFFVVAVTIFEGGMFSLELYLLTFQLVSLLLIHFVMFDKNVEGKNCLWIVTGIFLGLCTYAKQNGSLSLLAVLLFVWWVLSQNRLKISLLLIIGAFSPWGIFILFSSEHPLMIADGLVFGLLGYAVDYATAGKDYYQFGKSGWQLFYILSKYPWTLFFSLILAAEVLFERLFKWKKKETFQLSSFIRLLFLMYFLNLLPLLVNQFEHYYLCCVPSLVLFTFTRMSNVLTLFKNNRRKMLWGGTLASLLFISSLAQFSFMSKGMFGWLTSSSKIISFRQINWQRARVINLLLEQRSNRIWITANPLLLFLSRTEDPSMLYSFRDMANLETILKRLNEVDLVVLGQVGRNLVRKQFEEALLEKGMVVAYDPQTIIEESLSNLNAKFVFEPHLNCFLYQDDWTIMFARPELLAKAKEKVRQPYCVENIAE